LARIKLTAQWLGLSRMRTFFIVPKVEEEVNIAVVRFE